MRPLNEKANLFVVFQSQFCIPSIEIVFQNINKFNLQPVDPQVGTCEIFEASMWKEGDYYFWANEPGGIDPKDYSDEITWVSAKKVKWRTLDNALGEEEIYCTKV